MDATRHGNSVCSSVKFQYCIKTTILIISFLPLDILVILVFLTTNRWCEIRTGHPLWRPQIQQGCENLAFRILSRCVSDQARDRGIATMIYYSKLSCPISNVVSDDLG